MIRDWHAVAQCGQCEWRFEARGEAAAFDEDVAARRHERQMKGHAASQNAHRVDYCEQLGCAAASETRD